MNRLLDSGLDVMMSILPKIHIDNLEGETDDFKYGVGNIDLQGFHMYKENVVLQLNTVIEAGVQSVELINFKAWNMECLLEDVIFTYAMKTFPYLNGSGVAQCFVGNVGINLAFSAEWDLEEDRPYRVWLK